MERNSASASIVVAPGVSISSGATERPREHRGRRHGERDLEIGREVAVLAGDERVLARSRRREEVDAELAAHDPALRLDVDRLDPAAGEDPLVRLAVRLEAALDAVLVAVERVAVLHHELAEAQEAGARARLVPVLGLEVVPELRQLLVRLDLARVEGDGLLVRHRQHVRASVAVGDVKDLRDADAAGRLPQLGRGEHRHLHLLRADRVHLLADDLLDLAVDAPAERHERPQPGADLAHVAAAHEQLVRNGFRVRGVVAERGKEEL